MISSLVQHLEVLCIDLAAIDPEHTIDAADKVAEMAIELRRTLIGEPAAHGMATESPFRAEETAA